MKTSGNRYWIARKTAWLGLSPNCKGLFHLGFMLTAITIVASPLTFGQCTSNDQVGCTNPGTTCSPVRVGMGSSGKCTTPPGYKAGERSCVCTGPPPPITPLPACCTDITVKGTCSCTINKPIVTQPTVGYQQIAFAPGDHVMVNASGCVQTGGKGLTWKLYVNPSGPNSDRLYYGQIQLPGADLVRISTVIGQNLTVNQAGSLILGYVDDNYSDNGYTNPDNGTQNQCQGVGPATVTITISR
jgi:hypothetical protein